MLQKTMCLMVMPLFLTVGSVQGSIFVSTGQENANVTVDVEHTQYWTSTFPNGLEDLEGGVFAMKIGEKATASITFDVIAGGYVSPFLSDHTVNPSYSSIIPLLRVTLPVTVFDGTYQPPTLFSVARTWDKQPLESPGPLVDLAAGTYTAILYTAAETAGSKQYFLKGSAGTGGAIIFGDEDGNPVDPFAIVPEPGTLAIWSLLGGLGIVGAWRRRRVA